MHMGVRMWAHAFVHVSCTFASTAAAAAATAASLCMCIACCYLRRYVEQAFFQRWYRELDATSRERLDRVVKAGQLVFVNGGWYIYSPLPATPLNANHEGNIPLHLQA